MKYVLLVLWDTLCMLLNNCNNYLEQEENTANVRMVNSKMIQITLRINWNHIKTSEMNESESFTSFRPGRIRVV